MRPDYTARPGADWLLVKDSYPFSGPPDDCTGQLTLINQSQQWVRIRRLETVRPARTRKGYSALAATDLTLRITLAPNSRVGVSARLKLPPETPPGHYLAGLVVGDTRASLVIDVQPSPRLELDTGDIELAGEPGQSVSFRVRVRNEGNLPQILHPLPPIWLSEHNWQERILSSTLMESDPGINFVEFSQRLLDQARRDIPAPSQLAVTPSPGTRLDCGQTVTLTVSLTLPDNLKPGRSYHGVVHINDDQIELEVYCRSPLTGAHPPLPEQATTER